MGELEELCALLYETRGRQMITVPMLLLRWLVQQGVAVVPRSASLAHLEQNVEAATAAGNRDTQLRPNEMEAVRSAVEGLLRAANDMPPRTTKRNEL